MLFLAASAAVFVLLSGCALPATPTATPQPTAPLIPTAQATPTEKPSAQTSAANTVALQPSVWNTTIGPDSMTGTCAQGSVLPVYGLVQITPGADGSTLTWKNQEPAPYTLASSGANQFVYAGQSSIKDGVVTMTVTFADDKSFRMLREFVSNKDAACIHTHTYTGEFKWNK